MDEDAALALWSLVHTYLPYRIERRDEIGVQWSEEEETMVQQLDRRWIAEIEARGEARGALRAKRSWLKEDIAERFGALPPEVTARIDGIEREDDLDAIRGRLDAAASPDHLFA